MLIARATMDVGFVIPVFNQLDYTVQCLTSLTAAGVPDTDIVLVDNGSTDGTRQFLAGRPQLRVITNEHNRGCAAAWNQGVQAAQAAWTVILNNDVVVVPGLREALVEFAQEQHYQIVSPAMGEGPLDYDLAQFGKEFVARMRHQCRSGLANGVCFMVQHQVFERIGLFDPQLGLAGYEDEDFFRRARRAGFRLATTGRAYLHHFGSVTQKSVKAAQQKAPSARLADARYFRKKHGLNWLRRRTNRFAHKLRRAWWRWRERRRTGWMLVMRRADGQWRT